MSFSSPSLGASRRVSDHGFALYPHSLVVGAQQHPPLASTVPATAAATGAPELPVDIDLVDSPWNALGNTDANTNTSTIMPSSVIPSSAPEATAKAAGKSSKTKTFAAQMKKLFTSPADRERDKERQRLRQLSISSPTLIHSTSLTVQPPPNPLSRSTSQSSGRSRTRSVSSPSSPHAHQSAVGAYPSPTSSASSGADRSPAADQPSFSLPPEGVPPVPAVDPSLRARAQSLPAPSRLPPELMAAAAIADADQHYVAAALPDPAMLGMSWQSQSSLSTALGNASVVSLPNLHSSATRMQSPMVQPTALGSRRRRDSDMYLSSSSSHPSKTPTSQDADDWLPPTGVTKKLTLTPKVVADSSSSVASSASSSKSLPPPPPLAAPPRIPIWAQFQSQSSAPPGPLSPVSQAAFFSSSTDDSHATSSGASLSSLISSPALSSRGLVSSASSIQSTIAAPPLPLKSPALSTRSLSLPDSSPRAAPPLNPNDLLAKAPVPSTDPQDLLRLESLITATVDSERRVLQHLRKQSLSGASSPAGPTPTDLTTPATAAAPPVAPAAMESDLDRRLAKMHQLERLLTSSEASPALSSRSLTAPTPTSTAPPSLVAFPGASAEGDHMVALAALHRVQMDKYPVPACELASDASSQVDFALCSDDDELDDDEAQQVQQRVIARHPSLAHIFAPLMDMEAGRPAASDLRDPRALVQAHAGHEGAQGSKAAKGVKGWWAGNRTKLLDTLKHVLRDASGARGDAHAPEAKDDLVQFAKHVIRTTSASTLSEAPASGKRRTVTKTDVSSPIMEEGDEMDVINMYASRDYDSGVVPVAGARRRPSAKGAGARNKARLPVDSVVEKDDELVALVRQIEALMEAETALPNREE